MDIYPFRCVGRNRRSPAGIVRPGREYHGNPAAFSPKPTASMGLVLRSSSLSLETIAGPREIHLPHIREDADWRSFPGVLSIILYDGI